MSDETPNDRRLRLQTRLSVKQRRFCEEFLACGHVVDAYETAYGTRPSASTANTLLGRWYIRDYIEACASSASIDDRIVTKQEVIAHLASMLRDDGAKDRDRIAAARVLSQIRGFDAPAEVNVNISQGLTDAQVLQLQEQFLGIPCPSTSENSVKMLPPSDE